MTERGPGMQGSVAALQESAAADTGQIEGRSQKRIFWSRFRRHRLAMISAVILALLYALALAAPFIAPYGFEEIDFTALSQPPSLNHPMGTDTLGRDTFTRVLYGGRVSLLVGLSVGVLSTMIGTAVGIVAAYYGRAVDTGMVAFIDFWLTLPFLPLLLVLGSIVNLTAFTISLLLTVLVWPPIARLVRGQVLSIREQEYVLAAKAIGVSGFRTMIRHILPNVVGVMVVQATLVAGEAILIESILSFLGLGIQPPTPSWGNLLEGARSYITQQPWLAIFPGIMLVLTILCVNFLGDGLRDALDPKAVE